MWAVSGSRFLGEMCQLVALCARGFPALDQYRDNALISIKKWRPVGEVLGAVACRTCGNQPLYPGGGKARGCDSAASGAYFRLPVVSLPLR
ncbi:hypothetical protein [Burkholderia gladioli]|uniref:hypothetical protein n=1 Tax=Burkholderia gladioli TaxID=28095 RepID=UPI0012FE2B7D|nr:hypothetical protein [Burkholderia gladioli]